MRLISLLRTIKKLGWRNCVSVVVHRAFVRTGIYQFRLPISPCPVPEILHCSEEPVLMATASWAESAREVCLVEADALLSGRFTWFGNEQYKVGSPPEWFLDPSSGQHFTNGSQHWSRCGTFVGSDIKRCWELSRWGWAPLLARAWCMSGDSHYRDGLNSWIKSWCLANPINGGSNWLCGQEASIRLLHALQAWSLSDGQTFTPQPSPERIAFVSAHLQRIAATDCYSQAQDNNHWTSEAAALFIGGSWLATFAAPHAGPGLRWAFLGRVALERSVCRLVMPDGSFSQHSLTYHRLLLDTLAQVKLWCDWLDLEPFSNCFSQRCCAATAWLAALVDPISGDGPNLGSNDGAFCYQLHGQSYRDFRPTLQLASLLFLGHLALPDGPWDEPLYWFGLMVSSPAHPQKFSAPRPMTLFSDGGYAVLRPSSSTWGVIRLPTDRFRPAHADPLHFDLWHRGVNVLRDGGSYSYNCSFADLAYFPGIASHNTVQFDGTEPMPRLGRFLWGDWLKLEAPPQLEAQSLTAAYLCPQGRHQRQVRVDVDGYHWIIIDKCTGFRHQVLLRWRLCPGDWKLEGCSLIGPLATLHIQCDKSISSLKLMSGWESRHYGSKTTLPVLEICIAQAPATLTTSIQLST